VITVGSLFSGIGGMDLGLERAGMRVIWQSEIDPFASRVLARHWPTVPNLGDITTIDWSTVERPDLICGGYPCQPFSFAGKQLGEDDHRHLWPYMRDALRLLRPRYALLENVAAHLRLGFDAVLGDLADLGFDAEWSVVSACSVGAPHMRRRLFCVAHSDRGGWRGFQEPDLLPAAGQPAQQWCDTHRQGLARERTWNQGRPGSLGMAHGLPGWVDRRRCCGNAVVPQVAERIGRMIVAAA
jgi:DNA (cytosine-5)-methyltransferase 1